MIVSAEQCVVVSRNKLHHYAHNTLHTHDNTTKYTHHTRLHCSCITHLEVHDLVVHAEAHGVGGVGILGLLHALEVAQHLHGVGVK